MLSAELVTLFVTCHQVTDERSLLVLVLWTSDSYTNIGITYCGWSDGLWTVDTVILGHINKLWCYHNSWFGLGYSLFGINKEMVVHTQLMFQHSFSA